MRKLSRSSCSGEQTVEKSRQCWVNCSFLVTRTSLLIIDNITTADTIIVIMVFYCLATRQPVELQMEDNEYPPLGKGKAGY